MSAHKDQSSVVTSVQSNDELEIEWTIKHDHDPFVPAMVLCASIQAHNDKHPRRREQRNKRPFGAR